MNDEVHFFCLLQSNDERERVCRKSSTFHRKFVSMNIFGRTLTHSQFDKIRELA